MRLLWLGVWAAVSFAVASALFLSSSRSTVLASHEAVLRPTLDGTVQVRSGPLLPDLRVGSGTPLGVSIDLGKTNAASPDELLQRYALLGSHPEGQVAKVRSLLVDMALEAGLRGIVIGFVPMALWYLFGSGRRRELMRGLLSWRGIATALALLGCGLVVWQPWTRTEPRTVAAGSWQPLETFIGDGVPLPASLEGVEIWTDQTTVQSKRLVESAIDTFNKSQSFYKKAVADASELELREPTSDETVAVLVSDRHDNIGMDPVARAIGDRAGATEVLDAGDDTSTGQDWEAFSLDSLNRAFRGYDRYAVAGNHDNGTFVGSYLADLGWKMLDGSVTTGPGGVSLLGIDDPRSSGLGSWRDQSGATFGTVADELAAEACAQDEPVGLMLVHDANLGKPALAQGCVGLVVGGHVHVQIGPDAVPSADSTALGFSYTNGTTGGAAYAIAVGSKPRRDAQVSLVTFRDKVAVGIQPVTLRTDGRYLVSPWVPLEQAPVDETEPGKPAPSAAR